MKKITIIIALLALVTLTGQSQEVKMNEPSFDDYLLLLEQKGYMARSFDFSMFKGKKERPVVKEYVNGQETRDCMSDIPYLIVFPIEDKITVGFMPKEVDSLTMCVIDIEGSIRFPLHLKLKPILWGDKPVYHYGTRPFELVPPFKVGDFIPLMLYGSYWYDAEDNVTRFCGENFVKPDLSSENLLKGSQHYFVIGIKVEE